MEQYYKAPSMEFNSYPYEMNDGISRDTRGSWLRLESPKGFESFSFSVVYQTFDFPFPSIHYPSNDEDLLDSQFSVGCVHGGGSMLSSLDVSLESCFGMLLAKKPLVIVL
jgi:hypothetical protein